MSDTTPKTKRLTKPQLEAELSKLSNEILRHESLVDALRFDLDCTKRSLETYKSSLAQAVGEKHIAERHLNEHLAEGRKKDDRIDLLTRALEEIANAKVSDPKQAAYNALIAARLS